MSYEILFESVPPGWEVVAERDALRGELRALGPVRDPLPHAAVRVTSRGVHVVLEPGLQKCAVVISAIRRVVGLRLPRLSDVSADAVLACREDLEDLLARLAARREILPVESADGARSWIPAA